ncbi:unnamed protein product [Didymodactylos carnosus]|uniref:Integrase catalytic domain-containing protein n=1 Tax=Didymodactylos carnosus TaxID=1234261 RepID=A0A815XH39_9BILA|nr:unnamed protein product [Didymodactylos carnosus]CAF1557509.1 unnamed protein product [Didymodactylos carnosus]CAF4230126.1 unnamed protein product [Didymodactylos carnosus]CAF4418763.1 unnamed protein product [Didymodactylos carnosus]
MTSSSITAVEAIEVNNNETLSYVEVQKHIDSLPEKCREKSVIKQSTFDGIGKGKYAWAFPLKYKSAVDISLKLQELFFLFGPPRILHSDNEKEFVASVITELKNLFRNLCFVLGRPRHPQSQGCVEKANEVLGDALEKWMLENDSSHWSDGFLPVVYGINTRVSSTTKSTPDEVVFGQSPRSDSKFWKLVSQNGILDEEDLPSPVVSLDDDIENSTDVV